MLSARSEHIYHSWAACDRTMSQEKNKESICGYFCRSLHLFSTSKARKRLNGSRWQMERTSTPLYVTQEEVRVSLHPKEYRGCGGRRLTLSLTVENGAISNYSIICSALKKIMFCLYLSDWSDSSGLLMWGCMRNLSLLKATAQEVVHSRCIQTL